MGNIIHSHFFFNFEFELFLCKCRVIFLKPVFFNLATKSKLFNLNWLVEILLGELNVNRS